MTDASSTTQPRNSNAPAAPGAQPPIQPPTLPPTTLGSSEPQDPQGPRGPRNSRSRRWWLVLLAAVVALAVIVGGYFVTTRIFGAPSRQNSQVILTKDAVIYDSQKSDFTIISADEQTIQVSSVSSIKRGSVIVAGVTKTTPNGLLRRVESVTKKGSGYELRTSQAALSDVIEECDYHGEAVLAVSGDKITVKPAAYHSGDVLMPSAHAVEFGPEATVSYDKNGLGFEVKMSLKLDLKIHWKKTNLKLTSDQSVDVKAKLLKMWKAYHEGGAGSQSANSNDSDTDSSESQSESEDEAQAFWTKHLPPVEFMVGAVPVTVTNEISLTHDGEVESNFEPQLIYHQERTLGIQYATGKGFKNITEEQKPEGSFSFVEEDDEDKETSTKLYSLDMSAELGVNYEAKLYGQAGLGAVSGFYADSSGEVQLAAQADKEGKTVFKLPGTKTKVTGKAKAEVGIPLKIVVAVNDTVKKSTSSVLKVFGDDLDVEIEPLYEKKFPIIKWALPKKSQGKKKKSQKNGQKKKSAHSATNFGAVQGKYLFSSGAGAWSNAIKVMPNGTFSGAYADMNMGDTGDGHPNGTRYISEYTGKFSDFKKIDKYTYSAKVAELTVQGGVGRTHISNGVLNKIVDVYGLKQGQTALFVQKGRPTSDMGEGTLGWYAPLGLNTGSSATLPENGIVFGDTQQKALENGYTFVHYTAQ